MKKFKIPEIVVELFNVEDIITVSYIDGSLVPDDQPDFGLDN